MEHDYERYEDPKELGKHLYFVHGMLICGATSWPEYSDILDREHRELHERMTILKGSTGE